MTLLTASTRGPPAKKAFVLQALESSLAYFLQSSWNDFRAYAAMNTLNWKRAPSSGVCKSFVFCATDILQSLQDLNYRRQFPLHSFFTLAGDQRLLNCKYQALSCGFRGPGGSLVNSSSSSSTVRKVFCWNTCSLKADEADCLCQLGSWSSLR